MTDILHAVMLQQVMKIGRVGVGRCTQGQQQFAHPCLRPWLDPFESVRHGVCKDVWVQSVPSGDPGRPPEGKCFGAEPPVPWRAT